MGEFELISLAGGRKRALRSRISAPKRFMLNGKIYREARRTIERIYKRDFSRLAFLLMPYIPAPLKNGLVTAGFTVFGFTSSTKAF